MNVLQNIIVQINEQIIQSLGMKGRLGLVNGKMGKCVYFFKLSVLSANSQYRKHAEKVFDRICEELPVEVYILPVSELIHIGIGIVYLYRNNYIKGNINEILRDFDDRIFLILTSNKTNHTSSKLFDVIPALYYTLIRLEQLKKGSNSHFLMEELSIKLFNDLYTTSDPAFFEEPMRFSLEFCFPLFLYLLSKMYALHFYNYRLDEVIKEFIYTISSKIPVLHTNRLYLLWSLLHLKKVTQLTVFDEQIEILTNHINFQKIINDEFKNRDVFIKDGVSGVCLLLFNLEKLNCKLVYDKKLFIQSIENSDIWNVKQWESENLGLLNGFCGLLLVYHLLEKEIKEDEN
jgi:hypothetical protein